MRKQKGERKYENDKVEFKKKFVARLVSFSISVMRLCAEIRKDPNLRPVADQLIRSASSVGANVVEAQSASSKRDYIKFFEIALKSSNETQYWLLLIKTYNDAHKTAAEALIKESKEINNILGASVLTLKGKR